MVLHPEVAHRDCGHCQAFVYITETGLPARQKHGTPGPDGEMPLLKRNPRNKPPCMTMGESCPKGSPDKQRSLSERNWRAYRHWQTCKATGKWPEDGIVMRNAGIIEAALQQAEITRQWQTKKHRERVETLLATAIRARTV